MSASPRKRTKSRPCWYVRFVPQAVVSIRSKAALFDHRVGAGEERWWHVKTERLSCFQIDHQLVLGRRLHRQVGGLLALEDAVDVAGGAADLVRKIGPIGDQAAAGSEK